MADLDTVKSILAEIGISIFKEEGQWFGELGIPFLMDIVLDDTEDVRALLPRFNDLTFRYPKGVIDARR